MYKISINKDLFKDIQYKKINFLQKETSLYWKKELLQPSIEEDRIKYKIKQVDKILLTNGLGSDKPQLLMECLKIEYSFKKDIFEFHFGRILEQKNTDVKEDYKDDLIQQLIREKAQLEDSMNRDHLTKVYNRRKMENDLNLFKNQNNAEYLITIFIDADRFKGINDNFGHDTGDRVLVYLAQKLMNHAKRLNGEVYRYGGEEFIILCFDENMNLKNKLEELRVDIKSQKIYHSSKDISITVSMGVSYYKNTNDIDKMLKEADNCVYKAKENGRDTIVFA